MTPQRPTWPTERADVMADYLEMTANGATHEEASRRLGFTADEMRRRHKSHITVGRRKREGGR